MDPVNEKWIRIKQFARDIAEDWKGAYTMPGFNQTGPLGRGPMTGKNRGLCASPRTSFGSGFGRGLGTRGGRGPGRGFGGGFGRGYFTEELPYQANYQAGTRQLRTEDVPAEIDRLQAQAESMLRSLDAMNERIAEMEKDK